MAMENGCLAMIQQPHLTKLEEFRIIQVCKELQEILRAVIDAMEYCV
jgi:hypothetical protein